MFYWQIRQNPHKCTDQLSMFAMIINHGILTSPFGHTEGYKTNAIHIETMNSDVGNLLDSSVNGWLSNSQDVEFFSIVEGSICIVPFSGSRKLIIGKMGPIVKPLDQVPLDIPSMFVIHDQSGNIISISSVPSETVFKPLYRKFSIIKVIENYIGDLRRVCNPTTLCKLPQNAVRDELISLT